MAITLLKKDFKWLEENHPSLKFDVFKNQINGTVSFSRIFKEISIFDTYNISIGLNNPKALSIIPTVKETGERIGRVAKEVGRKLVDMHVNEDGTLCLCIYEKEREYFPEGFDLIVFFDQLLEPYLFWISYIEKYHKPPWDEYAHGRLGYLELFADGEIDLARLNEIIPKEEIENYKKMKGHVPCPCNGDRKLRNCHTKIYNAIYLLK
ncbi:MAG: hypothetical protein Q8P30_03285 [Candidatus Uhrbacteria bacterium]|nr:hypothetical protein [Candidatus Uhrbacteria bacterium]